MKNAAGQECGVIKRKFTARTQERARADAYAWVQGLHLGANAVGRPIVSVTMDVASTKSKSVSVAVEWRELPYELLAYELRSRTPFQPK